MSGRSWATAFAPASVGNVGVGFDVLGHVVDAVGDEVTVRRTDEPGVRIVSVTGLDDALPTAPEANTATAGLVRMAEELALPFGMEVEIRKGIPLGSGMGGSAASAVAGVVAANRLLPEPLGLDGLLRYALVGEAVASGAAHGDNVAPMLHGGLVLVRSIDPPDVVPLPVPPSVRCVLVHPHLRLDTRAARAVLRREVDLHVLVAQSANLAAFVAACFTGDLALLGRSLVDLVAEPGREPLVRGFRAVKHAAGEAGALGCSLSGAGPSCFAWCDGDASAAVVRDAMVAAFAREGVQADAWVSRVSAPGARVVGEG